MGVLFTSILIPTAIVLLKVEASLLPVEMGSEYFDHWDVCDWDGATEGYGVWMLFMGLWRR